MRSRQNRRSARLSLARNETFTPETKQMQGKLCQLYSKFQILVLREENRDFIEYAMLVAVIALATTAGMHRMAGAFNTVFTTLGTTFSTAIG